MTACKYTPLVGAGFASYEVRLPDTDDAVNAVVTVLGTADGVVVHTSWVGEDEPFKELVPLNFDQGPLPARDSQVMTGADWDNSVEYDGVKFTPFVTTGRVGVIATSPTKGTVIISAMPSTETDEGWGTGNAFFYECTDPGWEDLGEPWVHVAFGVGEEDEDDE